MTHLATDHDSSTTAIAEGTAAAEGELFERVCHGRDRIVILLLLLAWIACVVNFWVWWAQPVHLISNGRTAVDVVLMLYPMVVLPALGVLYLSRVRRVNPTLSLPRMRVAFLVTKAPSEPWDLVCKTLSAMQRQSYPHPYDIWLCDEDPSEATKAWCAERGIQVSTRHGVKEYHRSHWPRRTKCKEGNLAYFYDHWGYWDYDAVVQLDADHVPAFGYLEAMVRPFRSDSIGYVAAPSMCDANAADSWAARGRMYKEATFHGPMQAGCNGRFAPVCIGSHYAVRTSALHEIGGIGPELAEDFTTSFLMNSHGWEGAFALDAEAHGDGPATFSSFLVQEFQWAQSLSLAGLRMYFQNFKRLPGRLRLRFGLALAYYPMLAITTVAGLLLAPIAVVTGIPWMNVNYLAFVSRWLLIALPLVLVILLLRRRDVLRPVNAKILSWEIWLFAFARWPYVAWGVCSGVTEWVVAKPRSIKVTPKGDRGLEVLRVRVLLPYLGVCAIMLGAVWGRSGAPATHFYVLLCFLTAGAYLLTSTAIVVLHAVESQRATQATWSEVIPTVRASASATLAFFIAWTTTIVVVLPHLFS